MKSQRQKQDFFVLMLLNLIIRVNVDYLLSINQVTTRDQWSLKQAVEGYSRQGIHGIAVWRDKMMEFGSPKNTRQLLKENGMSVSGFCIGGLLTSFDEVTFQKDLDENRRIMEEAAIIESQALIFIAGGLPKGSKDIASARTRVLEGLSILLPEAKKIGVTIAIEPLHPMLAANRSVLTTMKEANDWCELLDTCMVGPHARAGNQTSRFENSSFSCQ